MYDKDFWKKEYENDRATECAYSRNMYNKNLWSPVEYASALSHHKREVAFRYERKKAKEKTLTDQNQIKLDQSSYVQEEPINLNSIRNKGNKMKETTTVEVKVNGQTVTTNVDAKKEKVKTDLEKEQTEKTGKYIVEWFNPDGFKMSTMHMTPKEVRKELQKPGKLGWTYRLYKLIESKTTDIPTKDLEV